MKTVTRLGAALAIGLLPAIGVAPAQADDHDHWHGGGDIHRFHDRDEGAWRGGRWLHGDHDGRLGWWWIVDGAWYFYPQPVYPYPDPMVPPVVVPPQPVRSYWYYCPNPPGYYPYVPACPTQWMAVPASPG